MRRQLRRTGIAVVPMLALLLAGGAKPAAAPPFMSPAVIIFRGDGLRTPVAMDHSGAKSTLGIHQGVLSTEVSGDALATLYATLKLHTPKSVEATRRRDYIEVAEFFGADYLPYWNGLVAAPRFESAPHISRIYLAGGGEPALWENPVVAPGGAQRAFYEISAEARAELVGRGVQSLK